MTKKNDPVEDSGRILNWVEANVFRSDKHNRHSFSRIANNAKEELDLDIGKKTISQAVAILAKEKNFNLAKYQFE